MGKRNILKSKTGRRELNPTDAFRKAQRNKEKKRNKRERLKVREEAQLRKNPTLIKEELANLKKLELSGELDGKSQTRLEHLELLWLTVQRRAQAEKNALEMRNMDGDLSQDLGRRKLSLSGDSSASGSSSDSEYDYKKDDDMEERDAKRTRGDIKLPPLPAAPPPLPALPPLPIGAPPSLGSELAAAPVIDEGNAQTLQLPIVQTPTLPPAVPLDGSTIFPYPASTGSPGDYDHQGSPACPLMYFRPTPGSVHFPFGGGNVFGVPPPGATSQLPCISGIRAPVAQALPFAANTLNWAAPGESRPSAAVAANNNTQPKSPTAGSERGGEHADDQKTTSGRSVEVPTAQPKKGVALFVPTRLRVQSNKSAGGSETAQGDGWKRSSQKAGTVSQVTACSMGLDRLSRATPGTSSIPGLKGLISSAQSNGMAATSIRKDVIRKNFSGSNETGDGLRAAVVSSSGATGSTELSQGKPKAVKFQTADDIDKAFAAFLQEVDES